MSEYINRQPLLDAQQTQLGISLSESSAIDAKVLAILGGNIAILIFIAQNGFELAIWQWCSMLLPFLISLAFTFWATWPRTYMGNVSIHGHEDYLMMEEDALVLQLISDAEEAIDYNESINEERLRQCMYSIAAFIAGSCVLFGFLLQ